MNKIVIVGRIGQNPKTHQVGADQKPVSNFSVATSESYKDKASGEWIEKTEWINCTSWSDLKWLKKGDLVELEGSIKTTENEGKYFTFVNVRQLNRLLSAK